MIGVDVKWHEQERFCLTSGSEWNYQSTPSLCDKIFRNMKKHYKATLKHSTDKMDHPLFLTLSGPGTGKSRLLDEFPRLAIETCTDSTLKAKLEGAYIFKIGFENGTLYDTDEGDWTVSRVFGCRMYYQLHPPSLAWDSFRSDSRAYLKPMDVLEILAKIEQKNLEEMTIFILTDGIHNLNLNKKDNLYQALNELRQLSNASGRKGNPFVISCAAATVRGTVSQCLPTSTQLRCYLSPPKLDGLKVFGTNDPVKELLVQDMGGHGRALETLFGVLQEHDSTDYSIASVMKEVCTALEDLYPSITNMKMKDAILATILTGKVVESDEVEDIEQLGLVTWNPDTKKLECPFVWLRIVHLEHLKQMYADADYDHLQHSVDPEKYPEYAGWKSWEDFLARFWSLKTSVFYGKEMKWQDLHAGASFKGKAVDSPKVVIKKMMKVAKLTQQCPSKSSELYTTMRGEFGEVKPRDCDKFILPDDGIPSGDGFCCVNECLTDGTTRIISFAISAKLWEENKTISLEKYKEEWQKAASEDDLFIQYTTAKHNFDVEKLPNYRCGFVSHGNFEAYFGPFAGRAFFYKLPKELDVNTARRSHLQAIHGIGKQLASAIINERRKERFQNAADLAKRIPRLKNKSGLFRYLHTAARILRCSIF